MEQNTIPENYPVKLTVPAVMIQQMAVLLANHPYKDVAPILHSLQMALQTAGAEYVASQTETDPPKKGK